MLPFDPDFRWGLKKEKSIWYKNITLFRQNKIGSWENVLLKIKKLLENK